MDIKEYISSGIIETYVLGLCTPEEEQELEQLRSQHTELNKAILEYEKAMEKNMLQQFTLPDEQIDMQILDKLRGMNNEAVVVPLYPTKKTWWKPMAAAAMILLLISACLNFYLYNQTNKTTAIINNNSLPEDDFKVMLNPAITPVAMYGVGTHAICRCTMFWDKKTGKMYIMIHHLPKSSSAKDYQLWATVDGKQVNVGTVQDEIRGRFIEMDNVPAGASSFIVTLEKAGEKTSPTIEETYLKGTI